VRRPAAWWLSLFTAASTLAACGSNPVTPTMCPDIPGNVGGTGTIYGVSSFNSDRYQFSCGGDGAPDWAYSVTADFDGVYSFDTEGSSFDTVLGLMSADCSVELGCDDNSLVGNLSRITQYLDAGQTVVIVVDGANPDASGGFHIHVRYLGNASDAGTPPAP